MTDLPKVFLDFVLADAQLRLDHAEYVVDRYHPTESPIERLFLIAFWLVGSDEGGIIFGDPPGGYNGDAWFFVKTQAPVLQYRADFLIGLVEFPDAKGIVVECDGHDFHERTKEQAARDRRRDREVQAAGYTVFRFTGSEIYRDAIKCAHEVTRQLFTLHNENSR